MGNLYSHTNAYQFPYIVTSLSLNATNNEGIALLRVVIMLDVLKDAGVDSRS